MNIYFSGIGGVAIGPLAEIARDAGYTVCGQGSSVDDQIDGLRFVLGSQKRPILHSDMHCNTFALEAFRHQSCCRI
jgi:UDP-N-acetylmuramate-alanine ligase